MTNPDWGTIASLATAGGTLLLAVSTFASVRSANRAARAAEQSLLVGLRPLMPSRLPDPEQKILFADRKWLRAPGGGGTLRPTVTSSTSRCCRGTTASGSRPHRGTATWTGRIRGNPDPAAGR